MGRILDAIRRKRPGPSTPTSISSGSPCAPPLNSRNSYDEVDKENASAIGNRTDGKQEPLRLGKREVLVDERDVDACIEVSLSNSLSADENETKSEKNSIDSDLVSSSSSKSTVSNEVTAVSVSELTEVSDDGILRDDEGNPIDQNEAEKNMLRDDEGNIIDPKSLVVRDFLLDLSCESDEYYDDEGEHIDPKELISCVGIGQALTPIVTDSSTHSEGEADCQPEFRCQPLQEMPDEILPTTSQGSYRDSKREPTPTCSTRDAENYENIETKGRKSGSSSRRQRRRKSSRTAANGDEYVHIMFNNRLTTLEEESLCSHHVDEDSGDEADDESPAPSPRSRQRSPRLNGIGSFDEKFIKARWEYALQMMSCGSNAIGAVIDVSISLLRLET